MRDMLLRPTLKEPPRFAAGYDASEAKEEETKEAKEENEAPQPEEVPVKPIARRKTTKSSEKYARNLSRKYQSHIRPTEARDKSPGAAPDYMKPTAIAALRSAKTAQQQLTGPAKKLLERVAEEEEQRCPFRPETYPNPYSEKAELNRPDRIEQLAQPTTVEFRRRERVRQKKEEAELAQECTFHPALVAKQNDTISRLETEGVEGRLYREAARKADAVEKV